MKRIAVSAIAIALAIPFLAATPCGLHAATEPAKPQAMTGEVVDMGCYLAHEAHGEKHIACGTKCVRNGMPMGLLTKSGVLYVVTMSHDNADPYNNLKEMVGKEVSITGPVVTRAGVKGIEVTSFKAIAPAGK